MSRKGFIILVWLLILLIAPITIFLSNTLEFSLTDPVLTTNLFQRLTGMLAFSLLFVQILLGSFINYWQRYIGFKTFRYHVIQGLSTYSLLLVHPILYAVFTYQTVNKIILFIIPRSDINPPGYEMFLTYGRIAFSLLTVGVIAGLLRNRPEIRAHWRKFHILNYFAFFFVSVHALNVGTDIKTPPFAWFFWIANFVILGVVLYRFLYPRIRSFIVQRQTSRSSA